MGRRHSTMGQHDAGFCVAGSVFPAWPNGATPQHDGTARRWFLRRWGCVPSLSLCSQHKILSGRTYLSDGILLVQFHCLVDAWCAGPWLTKTAQESSTSVSTVTARCVPPRGYAEPCPTTGVGSTWPHTTSGTARTTSCSPNFSCNNFVCKPVIVVRRSDSSKHFTTQREKSLRRGCLLVVCSRQDFCYWWGCRTNKQPQPQTSCVFQVPFNCRCILGMDSVNRFAQQFFEFSCAGIIPRWTPSQKAEFNWTLALQSWNTENEWKICGLRGQVCCGASLLQQPACIANVVLLALHRLLLSWSKNAAQPHALQSAFVELSTDLQKVIQQKQSSECGHIFVFAGWPLLSTIWRKFWVLLKRLAQCYERLHSCSAESTSEHESSPTIQNTNAFPVEQFIKIQSSSCDKH